MHGAEFHQNQPLDLIGLNEAQVAGLLRQLDETASLSVEDDRRDSTRFRAFGVGVLVAHPGGNESRYKVHTRNISTSGLSFLHGGFLHTDSVCKIVLKNAQGRYETIVGSVTQCRHVQGTIHEVGVRFERAISVERFLQAGETSAPTLTGRLIYLDASERNRLLLSFHLCNTSIELELASDATVMMSAVRESNPDIIMCDHATIDETSPDVIEQIRSSAFTGRIVLVTDSDRTPASTDPASLGVDSLLFKPIDAESLLEVIQSVLLPDQPAADDSVSVSQVIGGYVQQVREWADMLTEAVEARHPTDVRKICDKMMRTGGTFGFKDLAKSAGSALKALNVRGSVTDARGQLANLLETCYEIDAP